MKKFRWKPKTKSLISNHVYFSHWWFSLNLIINCGLFEWRNFSRRFHISNNMKFPLTPTCITLGNSLNLVFRFRLHFSRENCGERLREKKTFDLHDTKSFLPKKIQTKCLLTRESDNANLYQKKKKNFSNLSTS